MKRSTRFLAAGLAVSVVCPLGLGPVDGGSAGWTDQLGLGSARAQQRGRRARYKAGPVENGGTIRGVISWTGDIPEAAGVQIPLAGVHQTGCNCKQVGLDRLIIDEKSGGVRDAVVYLDGIPAGKALPERDIDFMTGRKAKLDQVNCRYVPHMMVVRRGSTLAISSSDNVLHNVHALMGINDLFNLAFPLKGQVKDDPSQTNIGRRPGIISLKCDAGHFWMNGTIFAVDHPYYRVTDNEGRFELTDVPPGEYTLKIWHENWEHRLLKSPAGQVAGVFFRGPVGLEQKVKVEAGKTTDLKFDLSKAESLRRRTSR